MPFFVGLKEVIVNGFIGIPYIVSAIAGLAVTGILYVFLISMCEIVENLKKMNGRTYDNDCQSDKYNEVDKNKNDEKK